MVLSSSSSLSPKTEDQCPSSKDKQREWMLLHSTFLFYQASHESKEAHSHQRGQSAFLNLPIQMLSSFKNTLADTPRIMFNHIWVLHGPITLTHNINHQRGTKRIGVPQQSRWSCWQTWVLSLSELAPGVRPVEEDQSREQEWEGRKWEPERLERVSGASICTYWQRKMATK